MAGEESTAYLFGGRTSDGDSDQLWAFDLATDTWSIVTPGGSGPDGRWGHTATWVPDVGLVVWSGQNNDGFFDDIWAFDPQADTWRELPSTGDVPPARYGSCASLGPDGRLWISHGFTADSGRFDDTRAYDFATGAWTDETPDGEVPVKRCLHDCYWSADQLILYGGQTTGTPALGDIWAYDLSTGLWTEGVEQAAAPRQLYALAVRDEGGIVLGGGALDGGFLDDAWGIGPPPAPPVLIPLFGDAGSPPPARAGATLVIDASGDRFLLFGGNNDDGLLSDLWVLGSN